MKKPLKGEHKIVRIVSNSTKSASEIRELAEINASFSTVPRTIRNAKYLNRLKIMKNPPLNAIGKEKRFQFTKEYMSRSVQSDNRLNDWRSVDFTDGKRFNLEGPDVFQYYFHDLRKEEVCLSRHHKSENE